ncbi:MAG: FAD:protein FMN transferase [Epsilonproteobacteria bacterium]|nr:FAD:protein FMN transferase [Campylobacterota bacterium]
MLKPLLLITLFYPLLYGVELIERTQVKMGTFATISLEPKDISHAAKAFEILENVENSLSSYRKETPISRLNRYGYAKLDGYAQEALGLSIEYYEHSGGYFDITVGSLTKGLYRFGESDLLPHPSLARLARVSIKGVTIKGDDAALAKGIKVDLGGMGKGYGVDRVSDYLKKSGVSHALIALSGDIRCLNRCEIAVQNPYGEGAIARFSVSQESGISTSGNYARYVKSQKTNHLLDPKSKQSQRNFDSITLISHMPNAALDAYATALSVMPKERAYEFLKSLDAAYIIVESASKRVLVSENIDDFTDGFTLFERTEADRR